MVVPVTADALSEFPDLTLTAPDGADLVLTDGEDVGPILIKTAEHSVAVDDQESNAHWTLQLSGDEDELNAFQTDVADVLLALHYRATRNWP